MVVTGTLSIDGHTSWDGLLLVIGRGEIIRSGAGNGVISGGVIVANVAGPDQEYGTDDDCTGGPDGDGFQAPHFEVNGGGNADIQYCSANVLAAIQPETYEIVQFLQH